jgi:hypothetical protein
VLWRGGRAVECTALEMRHACKGIGGSNPPLSAIHFLQLVPWDGFFGLVQFLAPTLAPTRRLAAAARCHPDHKRLALATKRVLLSSYDPAGVLEVVTGATREMHPHHRLYAWPLLGSELNQLGRDDVREGWFSACRLSGVKLKEQTFDVRQDLAEGYIAAPEQLLRSFARIAVRTGSAGNQPYRR